jgi:hypothetical protein
MSLLPVEPMFRRMRDEIIFILLRESMVVGEKKSGAQSLTYVIK